jgi:hypothetical protein
MSTGSKVDVGVGWSQEGGEGGDDGLAAKEREEGVGQNEMRRGRKV